MTSERLAWGSLALLLLALVGGAALYAGPATGPALGPETTFALAVESLARDGDLRLEASDRERFRSTWGFPAESPEVLEGGDRLAVPAVSAAALSPFVRLAGRRGIFLGSALALALAACSAAWANRRVGPSAPLLVALALAGSVAFHAPFRFGPWSVLSLLVAGGLALARGGATWPGTLDTVYGGAGGGTSAKALLRSALGGALVGLAVADDATLLPLLWPALAFAAAAGEPAARGRRIGATLAGAVVAVAGALAVAGPQWTAPHPSFDRALLGWNLVALAAGRHVGLLPWYLPVVALAAAATRSNARSTLPMAVALSFAMRLLLDPYDWAGSEVGPASLALLPAVAALWLWPGRPVARAVWLGVAVVAGALLWPLWLAPRAGAPGLAVGRGPARELLSRLPLESTLQRLPETAEVLQAGVRLRAAGPAVWEGARGLEMMGDAHAELMVLSPRRLTLLRLEFGGQAPTELVVDGARAGNTTFRPGGAVAFDLQLDRPVRRHPTAWSDEPVLVYPVRIHLPAGKPAPLPFALSLARPAVPEGEPPT
ncbi:MAG: hypothetical protein IPJ17_17030 [Holophagales bacterium]|nr:MAG: hypothetical protein IPJ17_17030 [Holophagales bacterium]